MRSIMTCKASKDPRRVYSPQAWDTLKDLAGLENTVYTKEDILAHPNDFANVDFLFSTWGMPQFTEDEIRSIFPKLQCLFYGAGSVQAFARPFLNCGVKVFSAWAANGIPVAEYTLAQILLANTGYFQNAYYSSTGNWRKSSEFKHQYPGNYDVSVGILGVGMIGTKVIELLKNHNIRVLACSPDLTDERAEKLGVQKSTLEEIFATCQVVSNHIANLPQTKGLIKKAHFASMLPYATFINTGRGAQIIEEDLLDVLEERPDLTALLDVTFPNEPPAEDSRIFTLPNCFYTTHIAGSLGNEVRRMGEYMIAECTKYLQNQPCSYEVTLDMLEWMA